MTQATEAHDVIARALSATAITVREVGLREGLQSTDTVLSTHEKLQLFSALRTAGARELNVVSFVNPATMPQMADAEAFLRGLGDLRHDTVLTGLVPNERGLERALAMRAEGLLDGIFVVFAESSSVLSANRMTASFSALLAQIASFARRASDAGLDVGVFISAAYGCSIEGRIDPARVVAHAEEIAAMPGVSELVISDSTGQADPFQVSAMFSALAEVLAHDQRLGVHFHDTRGAGLANVFAALVSPFQNLVLDGSFGGWGGDFPFIPEALGNVATEDLVEMLIGMGLDPGIDAEGVMAVSRSYSELSGRRIGARLEASSPIAWKRVARQAPGRS
jgi:hydroxymethylglutaryl-CoA lyase